jgi:hypothetical protein
VKRAAIALAFVLACACGVKAPPLPPVRGDAPADGGPNPPVTPAASPSPAPPATADAGRP